MPRLITLKRAADESGLPYSSLRDAALRGLFPVTRINRSFYVAPSDLEAFIRSRTERVA